MASRPIILATITDRCDFARLLGREAFLSRHAAEVWAREVIAGLKADEPNGPFDPVAEYDEITLNNADEIF